MANQSQITPFVWGDISLSETLIIDGIPHATKPAMGEWLEYGDPRDAINKIIERNPHLRRWSTAVKLTAVDGKNRDTEVFHPVGFLLIVMESGQPRAHAMKQAVAEFVHQFVGRKPMSHKERVELLKLRRTLLNDLAKTKDAFIQQAMMADLQEISLAIGQPLPALHLLGTDVKQLALGV